MLEAVTPCGGGRNPAAQELPPNACVSTLCICLCMHVAGVALELEAGDVAVLSSSVFHTSRPNASAAPRRIHLAQHSLGVSSGETGVPVRCKSS